MSESEIVWRFLSSFLSSSLSSSLLLFLIGLVVDHQFLSQKSNVSDRSTKNALTVANHHKNNI